MKIDAPEDVYAELFGVVNDALTAAGYPPKVTRYLPNGRPAPPPVVRRFRVIPGGDDAA